MGNSRISLAIFFLLLLVLSTIIYTTNVGGQFHSQILNFIFLVPPFVAVIAGIKAVKAYGSDNIHGKSLMLITAGLAAWFLGELFWAIFDVFLHISPYPSVADIFYILAYPLILSGIVKEILNYKTDISPVRSLMITGVAIVLSILVYNLSILPTYSKDSPLLENIIAASYGIGDVALILSVSYILVLTIDFKGGKLYESWFFIMLGIVFMLLGDLFFAMYTPQYEQALPNYKRIDLLWILSYTFFAVGLFNLHYMIKTVQQRVKQLIG